MTEKDIFMKTIETLNSTVSSFSATNASLQKRIDELTAQVAWLNRQLFGRKLEKLAAYDPNQLDFFSGQLSEKASEIMEARDKAVASLPQTTAERKREHKNRKMMEELPALEKVVIEPEGIDMNLYKKIGEEVTRVVEHKPGQLYIKKISVPNTVSGITHHFPQAE